MESSKITDMEIEKFVTILKDVTLFSMYSKSGSYQAASAIQNLAVLRADLVLPDLLDRYIYFIFFGSFCPTLFLPIIWLIWLMFM